MWALSNQTSLRKGSRSRSFTSGARQDTKSATHGFMWAQLSALWDKAAEQMAAKEALTSNGGKVHHHP
jgi:hypothetical protein